MHQGFLSIVLSEGLLIAFGKQQHWFGSSDKLGSITSGWSPCIAPSTFICDRSLLDDIGDVLGDLGEFANRLMSSMEACIILGCA
jgi:hypothetical protein